MAQTALVTFDTLNHLAGVGGLGSFPSLSNTDAQTLIDTNKSAHQFSLTSAVFKPSESVAERTQTHNRPESEISLMVELQTVEGNLCLYIN